MTPEWHARQTYENPPGDMFLHHDPMGRWPVPPRRRYGAAVWAVVSGEPGQGRFVSGGPRHMSRASFRPVIYAVLLLWFFLFAALLVHAGLL